MNEAREKYFTENRELIHKAKGEYAFVIGWQACESRLREAIAKVEAETVERLAILAESGCGTNREGTALAFFWDSDEGKIMAAAFRALFPDPHWLERKVLEARREGRDLVGSMLDHRPSSLDGKTWGFFIGRNDDRREDLDRQLAEMGKEK